MIFVFALTSLFLTFVSSACPPGTEPGFNGLCYKPYPTAVPWFQGETTCALSGGHLAGVDSSFTNAFLGGLGDFPFNHTAFWIGGTTNFLGGNWSWTDFRNFTYQNWASGYPNYALGYCSYQRKSDGRWVSDACTNLRPFICEYPQVQECVCPTAHIEDSSTTPNQFTFSYDLCPSSEWAYNEQTDKCYYFDINTTNQDDSMKACENLDKGSTLGYICQYNP